MSTFTRPHIVPEEGDEKFETDLVVFNPGYPERLRSRVEVLAGGVAAAFSVKLTLDADGLRDGIERAAKLRRATKVRSGTVRTELLGAYPVGLLAHSHVWKQSGSTPEENISRACESRDREYARHPRESLDYLCVADLNTWGTSKTSWWPPEVAAGQPWATDDMKINGCCITFVTRSDRDRSPAPVAVFIARLLARLSFSDPALRPFADGLRLTDTLGGAAGPMRFWALADVYSDDIRQLLPERARAEDLDWNLLSF